MVEKKEALHFVSLQKNYWSIVDLQCMFLSALQSESVIHTNIFTF